MNARHKLIFACTILLSACDKPPMSVEELQNALDGRWVFNSAYCQQMLPDDGLVDHVIVKDGILTGGVLAKGQWYRPATEESTIFTGKVEHFIQAHSSSCKEPLPTGNPMFIVFESFEQKFVLAYYSDSDAVFRLVDDKVIAGRRYDADALSRLSSSDTD